MQQKKPTTSQKSTGCLYCQAGVKDVDYKDIAALTKFMSSFKKILPRRRTGACSMHQRKISRAVKLARAMSLLATNTITNPARVA